MLTKKEDPLAKERYLAFALCAISRLLWQEIVDNLPYPRTKWRALGFHEDTLTSLKAELLKHRPCFEEIHACLMSRSWCPNPPCPSPEWMETVCKAGLAFQADSDDSLRKG